MRGCFNLDLVKGFLFGAFTGNLFIGGGQVT